MQPNPVLTRLAARARVLGLAALALAVATPAIAAQTAAPAAPKTDITVEVVASGLKNPWSLQFLPDGRMLVTERVGTMRVVAKDGKLSDPIQGLPHVVQGGQAGLLDVLLAPDFATTGTVYFSYSEPRGVFRNGTSVVRAKLTLSDTGGAITDGTVIFRQEPAISGRHHYGSRLAWAKDGTLFVTTGERASERDSAQDLGTHLGKVIRINADGSVPKDNPFVGREDARPEIWSYGHRNLQGAAVNPATGQLWTTEHGAQGGDELNTPMAGKNYGWPIITWGIDYDGSKIGEGTTKDGLEQPIYYWKPSIATSGLTFYTGDLFKGWKGNILAGGLAGSVVERLVLEGGEVVAVEALLTDRGERIRDVRQGPDGAVYVLTDDSDGKLLRLIPKI
ncbi:MAG: PQQ-dependent sugar dehydrogenase [Hyphomicrobium sp.]|nr:PQQ-dependent sugar dehydrogenase [Hyphomicrobium sp.]